jgi:hypothetical protein
MHQSDPILSVKRQQGVRRLIAETSLLAARYPLSPAGTRAFLHTFVDRYAFIRLQDMWRPYRFLSQMEGAPPVRLGIDGFKRALVDDINPARHYTAFLFVGYWLPNLLSLLVLWSWEFLGFLRYGFYWSNPDVRSGYVGLSHGRLLRRYGHTILPALMARDLTESGQWSRYTAQGGRVKNEE